MRLRMHATRSVGPQSRGRSAARPQFRHPRTTKGLPASSCVLLLWATWAAADLQECTVLEPLRHPHCICAGNPIFVGADANQDNAVSGAELAAALAAHGLGGGPPCSGGNADCSAMMFTLDANADGAITLPEFTASAHIYINRTGLLPAQEQQPPLLICDLDPNTNDTAACPAGCADVAFSAETTCTSTATAVQTCDLDAETDGTAACPAGCTNPFSAATTCSGAATTVHTCDLDAGTDGTAACPAGCADVAFSAATTCTGTATAVRTCDLDAGTDDTAACPFGCADVAFSAATTCSGAATAVHTCDLDAGTDGTAACPAGCTLADDSLTCTGISIAVLACDLDAGTDGTAVCPAGCDSDEVAADCTGTSIAVLTCDLDAGTDGSAGCPAGCDSDEVAVDCTGTSIAVLTCDLDAGTDGSAGCPAGCDSDGADDDCTGTSIAVLTCDLDAGTDGVDVCPAGCDTDAVAADCTGTASPPPAPPAAPTPAPVPCQACARGWSGPQCDEAVEPLVLELAVMASESYFDAFAQEKLRRAVAATLSIADERVLHSGVQTTDTDGQVFQLVMLDGHPTSSYTAVQPLLARGDRYYQKNLWESMHWVSIVCPWNCSTAPQARPDAPSGYCDGMTGTCVCNIGYFGEQCGQARAPTEPVAEPGMTFGDYALWVLVTFVALPCCFVLVVLACRRCSRRHVQVVPFGDGENNQSGTIGKSFWRKNKKVADGMAQKNPVTGKPWDVLDMAALQPVAPAGGAIGLKTRVKPKPMTATDQILAQFEKDQKTIKAPAKGSTAKTFDRKIGA